MLFPASSPPICLPCPAPPASPADTTGDRGQLTDPGVGTEQIAVLLALIVGPETGPNVTITLNDL